MRSKLIYKLILMMIITNENHFLWSLMMALSISWLLQSQYIPKSEKYYHTSMLQEVYHKVVDKIKAMIQPENTSHSFSYITDCW